MSFGFETQLEFQRWAHMSFRLARMCALIKLMTLALLALPLVFSIGAALGARLLAGPALVVALIYGWVWTRFRPTAFVVHPHALEVIWPLKRREIRHDQISAVRLIARQELRRQTGWGMRVGAGAFGAGLAGSGPGAGESCRCTSRASIGSYGSSGAASGRG